MLIEKNTIEENYINIYSLHEKKIGIPIFQRFYDWKIANIEQLKADILESTDNEISDLYLLDFIIYEEDGIIKLADGQQRIVTLNNLIKAIKDVAKDQQIQIENIETFDIVYDIQEYNKQYVTHFENYPRSPFKIVYLNLKEYVEENIDKINKIISVIKNNIYIYTKKCKSADDAFLIFQQINTGGKPLTKDEIIKTAIEQYSKIYKVEVSDISLKAIKQTITSYYKFQMDNPDGNFDNMKIISFLKSYITKDKNSFQSFINTIKQLKKLENHPIKFIIEYINRATLLDLLNILTLKNIDVITDNKYTLELLLPLCLMSIILTLNNGSPTTFRYLLNEVIRKIKANEQLSNIKTFLIDEIYDSTKPWRRSLAAFEEDLGKVDVSSGIKKALLIMDIIIHNTSGIINVKKVNLEHIYPQKPKNEWAINGWPPHSDEQKRIINNIGNLFLLCENINKKIQNSYISEKIIQYKRIIDKDKILQTTMNTIDFDEFEEKKEEYIIKRQKEIAKLIQKDFPLGTVLITNESFGG